MNGLYKFCSFLTLSFLWLSPLHAQKLPFKVIIGAVGKNVDFAAENSKTNIEILGECFADYVAIIYENNSEDETANKFTKWALNNPALVFITENLAESEIPLSRTEKIAKARNMVLACASMPKYADFTHFIMVDLDFLGPWPISEILETLNSDIDWDCVAANGVGRSSYYFDRYAFRDIQFPFGPELLGEWFWTDLTKTWFMLNAFDEWLPVFSAFGGLAIYKMDSIRGLSYSGVVTDDLKKFYKDIIFDIPKTNRHLQAYLKLMRLTIQDGDSIPILFQPNTFHEHSRGYMPVTCCEHLPLHASMYLNGFRKIYINPKMLIYY